MVHKCYPSIEGGCLDDIGKCKRNYENDSLVPETYLDDRGFPVYRRRTQKVIRVVPHNRLMLLDCDGHVNVEYSASTYTVSLNLLVILSTMHW